MCEHLNLSSEFIMLWNSVELETCIALSLFCVYFSGTAVYVCVEKK